MQGKPPTFIITARYDVLRDEGEAFANRLVAEGIRVTLHLFSSQIHAFMRWGHVIFEAAVALAEASRFLRATFHDGGRK
jgi:acetyl esterase